MVIHLTVANSLAILCKGIPKIMADVGWKECFSDTGCKLFLYAYRVGRGVSFGSTCLLSIFQAITISPSKYKWEGLEVKAPTYIGLSNIFCWVLHMLINLTVVIYVTGSCNKNITKTKYMGLCSYLCIDKHIHSFLIALWSLTDVALGGLMLWASGYMVFILYRHKTQVQHIHRNTSPRSSPEARAIKTVLVLVSTFALFYSFSCASTMLVLHFHHPSWWLMHIDALAGVFYQTISPFVLLGREPGISRLCFAK
ncbi:vomeronasal type-1 receptor 2-like [Rhynchocyon petersi]